ncbi:MAG TPA: anti-sigma factor [Gemmatimonadales bacterium]|nr:anti-sigma factor [Gemmatimonadales bacterium]
MTTDLWMYRLSEYLDDELTPPERAACEAHLAGCAECRATLDELRRVVARARSLEDRPPARELWSGIAARIGATPPQGVPALAALTGPEAPVVSLDAGREAQDARDPRAGRRRISFSLPQLAAAGLALTVLSAGATALLTRQHPAPAANPAAAVASGPGAGALSVQPAAAAPGEAREIAAYDRAVGDLQQVLQAGRGRLDPATVRVLERNLAVIDTAIAEAQHALAADPQNAYLSTHLARTMRQKLDLLRRAATLVQSS